MRRSNEQLLDEIFFVTTETRNPPSAPPLLPVRRRRETLDVAAVRDADHHVLVGNQVLRLEIHRGVDDLRAALVAVLRTHRFELFLDDRNHLGRIRKNALELGDQIERLFVLLFDLVALQPGQALQAHLQNGLRLHLAELELLLEARRSLGWIFAGADGFDDGVDVVERDAIALEDVGPLLRLVEIEPGAAHDDVFTVLDEVVHELLERHRARPILDQSHHVHTERRLHLRAVEELVQEDLRHRVLAQLDDDAHATSIRFVT